MPAENGRQERRFAAWHIPAYRRAWFGTMLLALATWSIRLAIGWLVLVETDSIFLTAAVYAIQKIPGIFAAPIAGYISDRVIRSRMLAVGSLYKTVVACGLALLALSDVTLIWPVFLLVALLGIGQSIEIPATQGLITDTVPRQTAMNAVTIHSTGARAVGAIGGLVGGIVIKSFGVPTALFGGAGVFLVGAIYMYLMPVHRKPDIAIGKIDAGLFLKSARGMRSLLRLPIVRTLLLATMIVEIFGFAYNSILPSFTRDVFELEADGLGTLTMMAGFGSVIGVVILSTLGNFKRKGLLIIGATVGYGLTLAAFAASGIYGLSLILVTGVGAMAAGFDAMQWTALQQNVPDDMRGQAIGGWVFAIGFGWVGPLILGAAGEAFGAQWALAGSGVVLILTAILIFLSPAGLRKV